MIIQGNIWKLIRYLKIDILMLIMLIMLMLIMLIIIIVIKCLMAFAKFVKIKQNYVQVYYVLINIVWNVGYIIFDNN